MERITAVNCGVRQVFRHLGAVNNPADKLRVVTIDPIDLIQHHGNLFLGHVRRIPDDNTIFIGIHQDIIQIVSICAGNNLTDSVCNETGKPCPAILAAKVLVNKILRRKRDLIGIGLNCYLRLLCLLRCESAHAGNRKRHASCNNCSKDLFTLTHSNFSFPNIFMTMAAKFRMTLIILII